METNAPAFTAWLDDFFAAYYRRRPVNATFIGVHEYDDRLPDLSKAGMDETVAEMRTLLRRLRELPQERLTESEGLDRRLAAGFLEIGLWEFGSDHFQRGNPSFYTGEAIFGVIGLFLRPFAPIEQRVEAALARLAAVPALLAQGVVNVRAAPLAWTERAIRECTGALAFLQGGVDLLIGELDGVGVALRRAADEAAAAFGDYQHYLETHLRARPVDTYACGDEAFDLLMRQGHALEQDAAVVEAYALEQADLSEAHLRAHAADFGARSWGEALAGLSALHPPVDRYYARFGEVWAAARDAAERAGLLTWPDFPIRYVPQPRWAREAAPYLYFLPYRSPSPYGPTLPVDYLAPPIEPEMDQAEREQRLRATNDSVIKLNHVVHHGGLGHHIQNYHAARAASRVGRVAATDCAARIAMFCGGTMAEGWACYATDLMGEIGFLTPLERYAESHARLRMAARAIVDVRLHHGAITLDEAAAYYRERVGMAPAAAHAEAVKNSMFPGAAMMYLVGADLIHDLRRALSARQGASFDLRAFHDRFLSYGSVPVALISRLMREEDARAE